MGFDDLWANISPVDIAPRWKLDGRQIGERLEEMPQVFDISPVYFKFFHSRKLAQVGKVSRVICVFCTSRRDVQAGRKLPHIWKHGVVLRLRFEYREIFRKIHFSIYQLKNQMYFQVSQSMANGSHDQVKRWNS